MSNTLSEQDVADLLAAKSPISERSAGRLSEHLSERSLSQAERTAVESVMRGMLQGAAVKVRQVVAETLKDSDLLPHDIALALASDVESVALPVLQFSSVLTDEDLIQVVQSGTAAKQVAVAQRSEVSSDVAEALIHTDNSVAVSRLMVNPGARLNDSQIEAAADKFGMDHRVTEAMKQRANLPVTVAERLVAFTIERLRAYLAQRSDLSEAAVNQLILRAREQATVDLRDPHFPAQEGLELVQHLHSVNRLTPSLILRAICVGDIGIFEAAMSVLTNVPIHNARILIHDSGHLGLQSIYQRSGLPESYLPAFRVALKVVEETPMDGGELDRERYRRLIIERILTQFEALGADDLDYLMIRLDDPNVVISSRQGAL
ncbi:MAG TPA: DUF2336 domain-containing protein [Stellaceae bacterium]|jgi:uncharacterized protein (DUF2336 family)|nr:DUF2336 domain-containing protein [Stellaceae bacterium]